MSQRRLHSDYEGDERSVRRRSGPEPGGGSELMDGGGYVHGSRTGLAKASREERQQ